MAGSAAARFAGCSGSVPVASRLSLAAFSSPLAGRSEESEIDDAQPPAASAKSSATDRPRHAPRAPDP